MSWCVRSAVSHDTNYCEVGREEEIFEFPREVSGANEREGKIEREREREKVENTLILNFFFCVSVLS